MTLSQKLKTQRETVEAVKSDEIFFVSRELVYQIYKELSSQNKITKHYRAIMKKRSISSNLSMFMSIQMFSADLSLKYEPSKLEQEFAQRVGDYLISNDKNENFASLH